MSFFTMPYTYKGEVHEIFETLEMHTRLAAEPDLVASYLTDTDRADGLEVNTDSKDMDIDPLTPSEPEDDRPPNRHPKPSEPAKFTWTATKTNQLLDLYYERRDRFMDPRTRKKTLWAEVMHEMQRFGYDNMNVNMLDKKFRNLKITYSTIRGEVEKRQRSKGTRRDGGQKEYVVRWEFFDKFEEIFDKGLTTSVFSPIRRSLLAVQRPAAMIKQSTSKHSANINPSAIKQEIGRPKLTSEKYDKAKQLSDMRKQLILVEQERVETMRELKESIDTSNEIQRERNELLKRFLDAKNL